MKVGRKLRDLFFPPRCVICDRVISRREHPVCPACIEPPPPHIIETACPRCGREKRLYCTCKRDTFLSDRIAAPFYFEGAVQNGIHRFKKVEDVDRTRYFADEMCETAFREFGDLRIDYVTAVPVSRHTYRDRGFNQSERLARLLSKDFHVPYVDLLVKRMETGSQKGLKADERRVNLLGVFDVDTRLPLTGKQILLIDDVVTTGSTTNECAKMLKLAGAEKVYVLALALTRPKNDKETESR